ncbi:hypothetical protein APV89_04825 [Staphylococcus aureus]|nr:hypothetical protein CH52_11145 [Staphylococcus aureus]EPR26146.1 hypothetical protein L800_02120 [Staphylococcus aureus SA_ST125_MupR]EPX92453.1 hypothetical protein L895_07455 [Staphylococcus aureus SA16]KDA09458.1 hypothetical protein AZ10_08045 [Staphylococcus aureus MM66]KST21659.1 hypothetical protein N922_01940 [Staphylococcus aureus MRSA_CVMN25720PS]OFO35554.1 hypothetical protein HMPREF3049_07200 [Staphylococcus sp. HMSC055H07]
MGPQHREFRKEILQAMQVGVWAPTQRNWIPNFYRQCKLGWDNEINFAKISFLSHSLMHEFYSCNFIFKDILHLANV